MPVLRLLEEGKEKGGTVFLNNLYCKLFLTKLYNLHIGEVRVPGDQNQIVECTYKKTKRKGTEDIHSL
jgi:hypothetical protein